MMKRITSALGLVAFVAITAYIGLVIMATLWGDFQGPRQGHSDITSGHMTFQEKPVKPKDPRMLQDWEKL